MGKYMRKAKITGDVAVMEVSQSSLGVWTRSKTLAWQRLQAPASSPSSTSLESCYLQLRNRRLDKPSPRILNDGGKIRLGKSSSKDRCRKVSVPNSDSEPNSRFSSRFRVSSLSSGSVGSFSISCPKEGGYLAGATDTSVGKEDATEGETDLGIEASIAENTSDFELNERNTRESTPCSFIRESSVVATPGSTTRPPNETGLNRKLRGEGNIPTTLEMEEFFAFAEQQQQSFFAEKYNFDVVNDLPLHGRYEWVRVNP